MIEEFIKNLREKYSDESLKEKKNREKQAFPKVFAKFSRFFFENDGAKSFWRNRSRRCDVFRQ